MRLSKQQHTSEMLSKCGYHITEQAAARMLVGRCGFSFNCGWWRRQRNAQKNTARCKLSGHLHAGTTSAKQAQSKDSPLYRRRACSAGRERHECSDARSPEAPPQVGCKIAAVAAGCGTDVQVLSDGKSQQEREQMAGDAHSRNIGDTHIT